MFCETIPLGPAAQCQVTVGPKGESGFTEEKELWFNTFLEKKCCTVTITISTTIMLL